MENITFHKINYISGPTKTGKTTMIKDILYQYKQKYKDLTYKIAYFWHNINYAKDYYDITREIVVLTDDLNFYDFINANINDPNVVIVLDDFHLKDFNVESFKCTFIISSINIRLFEINNNDYVQIIMNRQYNKKGIRVIFLMCDLDENYVSQLSEPYDALVINKKNVIKYRAQLRNFILFSRRYPIPSLKTLSYHALRPGEDKEILSDTWDSIRDEFKSQNMIIRQFFKIIRCN